jgi:hypothetical protein
VLDLFWDCLEASEAVDADLLAELRSSWTPDSWRPVGEILIRSGVLTLRQVAGLIGMQATEPHMRIGDLAIREALCTKEQIMDALRIQRASCPGPIEILMQDERIEGEELLDALLKYARFLEGRLLQQRGAESSVA